mmetsp:Transcript_45187/g.79554  ORF Transcript_45187/g.79554 Transcript_45187/m.79554 type:complete len:115 (+) Transcript_45187:80-424(+)
MVRILMLVSWFISALTSVRASSCLLQTREYGAGDMKSLTSVHLQQMFCEGQGSQNGDSLLEQRSRHPTPEAACAACKIKHRKPQCYFGACCEAHAGEYCWAESPVDEFKSCEQK